MNTQQTISTKSIGAHVGGRAYTVWLDATGKPIRVMSCGSRIQSLALNSRTARAVIAKATA
jgi:hypothetical protein